MVSISQISSTRMNNLQKVSFTSKQNGSKKTIFPGVASVVLPGSGQMMNGEVKKGLGLFGIYLALQTAGMNLGKQVFKATINSKSSALKLPLSCYAGVGLAGIALSIYSGINAYKHSADDKTCGKNTFKSITSYFIPGSGQLMNGEVKKGLGFLAGAVGLMLLSVKNIGNAKAIALGALAATTLTLVSAVDAYRHNKAAK